MTAPAAAPASAPVAAPPPRAAPQPPGDAHAFAAVLDALPGGALKASASTAGEEPHPSGEKRLDQPPGQRPGHSLPGDGLLLASLPLAVQAASMIDGSPHAADPAPSRSAPAAKGPESEGGGASVAASARTAALGRLIGQRAFHFGASTSGMTRLALDFGVWACRRFRRRPCAPERSRRRSSAGRGLAGRRFGERRSTRRGRAGVGGRPRGASRSSRASGAP